MHDTESRCAEVLAKALGSPLPSLVEADTVSPIKGVAEWNDGESVAIHASVSGIVALTFDDWTTTTTYNDQRRSHRCQLIAAMMAIEEAREAANGVVNDPS